MDNIQVTFLHLIGLFSCHMTLESSLSDHVISLSHHVTLGAVNPGSKTHVTSSLRACFWQTRLCSLLLNTIRLQILAELQIVIKFGDQSKSPGSC